MGSKTSAFTKTLFWGIKWPIHKEIRHPKNELESRLIIKTPIKGIESEWLFFASAF